MKKTFMNVGMITASKNLRFLNKLISEQIQ